MCNISVRSHSGVEQTTTSCTTGCFFLFIGALQTNFVHITTMHETDFTNVKPIREKGGGTEAPYEAVEPGVNAPLMSPDQRRLTSASRRVPQSHFLMLLLAVCHIPASLPPHTNFLQASPALRHPPPYSLPRRWEHKHGWLLARNNSWRSCRCRHVAPAEPGVHRTGVQTLTSLPARDCVRRPAPMSTFSQTHNPLK